MHVRFIEFMPLDGDDRWSREIVVPQAEIIRRIDEVLPLEPIVRGHEPAERFRYLDGGGDVGVIASITQPFCDTCDRVRLTADGQLRACLFAVEETDLRALLRGGASDDEVAAAIERDRGREVGRAHDPAGRLHPAVPLDERDRRLTSAEGHPSRMERPVAGQECRPCARSAARPVAARVFFTDLTCLTCGTALVYDIEYRPDGRPRGP